MLRDVLPLGSSVLWVLTAFGVGLMGGVVFVWPRSKRLLREAQERLQAETLLRVKLETRLDEQLERHREQLAWLGGARTGFADAFQAAAAEALQRNNQVFLDLAKSTLERTHEQAKGDLERRDRALGAMLTPVCESLSRMDRALHELEKTRLGAYEGLVTQVRSLAESQKDLRSETGKLVQALRSPAARGRWGEIQLQRVVEMAGMLEHCDFHQQRTVAAADGKKLRPDLVVNLPGGRVIVVDAKVPLEAYLTAHDGASDAATKQSSLAQHARHVREHIKKLAEKSYWDQFPQTPEFVVMFLPGEPMYGAALAHDPSLLEFGVQARVIVATPTTLIALLRSVAYGWRQEQVTKTAQDVARLGKELYERCAVFGGYMRDLGTSLGASVRSYNEAVASLESRLLVSARRFRDLNVTADGPLPDVLPVDQTPRMPQVRAGAGAGESSA